MSLLGICTVLWMSFKTIRSSGVDFFPIVTLAAIEYLKYPWETIIKEICSV